MGHTAGIFAQDKTKANKDRLVVVLNIQLSFTKISNLWLLGVLFVAVIPAGITATKSTADSQKVNP